MVIKFRFGLRIEYLRLFGNALETNTVPLASYNTKITVSLVSFNFGVGIGRRLPEKEKYDTKIFYGKVSGGFGGIDHT